MAKEHKIPVDLVQIKISEVGAHRDTADLLVTTAMTQTEYPFPVINARSFFNRYWNRQNETRNFRRIKGVNKNE